MAFTKITAAGIGSTETVTIDGLSVINDGSFGGNVTIGGTLTYEDVTNIDSVGLITARAGVNVGSGITLSKDGDIFATGITTVSGNVKVGTGITLSPDGDGFFTGVVTATSYAGDGSALTGISVDSTQIVTGNTSVQTVDTGSDGHVKVNTEGTERLRILANGHVNIGDGIANDTGMFKVRAADGDSADLYVGQFVNLEATAGQSYGVNVQAGSNSTDHGFRVMNRANDTTQFLVRGDGNIGIGTNSPQEILHVKAASEAINTRDGVIFGSSDQLAADKGLPLVWAAHIGTDQDYGVASICGRKENSTSDNAAGYLQFGTSNAAGSISERMRINSDGHVLPGANDTYDLGSSSLRWRDVYTGDLNLSNEGKSNDVDGTWGNYTIQEGENDLFLINNRSGKKYKFNLTEVS